jgi:acyl dehydratase
MAEAPHAIPPPSQEKSVKKVLVDPNEYGGPRGTLRRTITDDDLRDYACTVGDINPIHFDEQYALGTRFGKPIVHGAFLEGLISSILGNDFPGHGTIFIENTLRFLKPVYVGQTVRIGVAYMKHEPLKYSGFRWFRKKSVAVFKTLVKVNGVTVASGEARILPPKGFRCTKPNTRHPLR